MINNIIVEITPEEFDKIQDSPDQSAIDKKLGLIFKVVSPLQSDVITLKKHAEKRETICTQTVERLEKNIQNISTPKLNKTKIAGFGAGSGIIGALIAKGPELIKEIGAWLHK